MSERKYEALHNTLASIHTEDFDITTQTEKDCVHLMSSEVSLTELVAPQSQINMFSC